MVRWTCRVFEPVDTHAFGEPYRHQTLIFTMAHRITKGASRGMYELAAYRGHLEIRFQANRAERFQTGPCKDLSHTTFWYGATITAAGFSKETAAAIRRLSHGSHHDLTPELVIGALRAVCVEYTDVRASDPERSYAFRVVDPPDLKAPLELTD